MAKTKVCLHFELYHAFNGKIIKKMGGNGVISAYETQQKILQKSDIDYTFDWDDSCDILQVNYPGFRTFSLIKKAKKQNKKVILWAHTSADDFKNSFLFSNQLSGLLKKFLIFYLKKGDLIFCPSEHAKKLISSYGLPAEKIKVVSNGVDSNFFKSTAQRRKAGRKKYQMKGICVGMVGIVIKRKGIKTFLNLAREFPKHRFYWFGKIFSSKLAESLPKKLPKNAIFTDYIGRDKEMPQALSGIDIFLFPSHEENQGIALLEAASAGLPILTRDLPAYQGWLVHQENCFKAKSEKDFKKYLKTLLEEEAVRKKLSENAKKMAKSEDISEIGKKVKKIYQELLS